MDEKLSPSMLELLRSTCLGWLVDEDRMQLEYLLAHPDFEHPDKCHDWRNHVPDVLKEAWGTLSLDTRGAVVVVADEAASWEEWE